MGNPRRIGTESLDDHSNGNLHEADVPSLDAQKPDAKIVEGPDMRVDGDLMSPSRGDAVATGVEEPLRRGLPVHSAADGDGLMQHDLDAETHMEMDETQNEVGGVGVGVGVGCIKHSNGLMHRNEYALLKDGKCGTELSDNARHCSQGSGNLSPGNDSQLGSSTCNSSACSASKSVVGLPNDSGVVCKYHCCSQCLVNLRQLLLKVLKYQRNLRGNNLTAEDYHDLVCSLSTSLQSAARKLFAPNHGCDEKLMNFNESKDFPCQGVSNSKCWSTGWGQGLMPINCSCHSASAGDDGLTRELDLINKSSLKLIFRDGVLLAPVEGDDDKDAPFHCKFEKLCLCSLVESIVTRESRNL